MLAICQHLTIFTALNVIAFRTLETFWSKHADSKNALQTWYSVCRKGTWQNFNHLSRDFPDAFPVGDDRVVFDIKGNRYRLVARVLFKFKVIQIKWIGTHADYNRINVETINN
ncbi:MAG: type II toxin-antitoxin system HigB family toxin [Cyclobacteriaceae bacterium]|jgi:mRNA interferase HigB